MLNIFGKDLLFRLIAVVVGIAVHEFGHAAMALTVGDDTARRQGRVTLNPLAHLDPVGLFCLFIAGFGWGRPVQIDPRKMRVNPRLGVILVALAGPFMSALTGALSVIILMNTWGAHNNNPFWQTGSGNFIIMTLSWMAYINIAMAVFNLLPVPPLDGWNVLANTLPLRARVRLFKFERVGPFLLLLILLLPPGQFIVQTVIQTVMSWFVPGY